MNRRSWPTIINSRVNLDDFLVFGYYAATIEIRRQQVTVSPAEEIEQNQAFRLICSVQVAAPDGG
jgi:hypothetical protein